jgi:hypothetical protein
MKTLSQETFTNTPLSVKKLVLLVLSMKKVALALALIISAILSLVTIESQVTTIRVKGNAFFGSGSIHIGEPLVLDGVTYILPENKTYYSSTIIVSYRAIFPNGLGAGGWGRKWIFYSLDGGENVTVYDEYNALEDYNGTVKLSGLSAGNHIVDIYSKNGSYMWGAPDWGVYSDASERAYYTIVLSGESPAPTPTVAPTQTPTLAPTSAPTATPEPTDTPEVKSESATSSTLIFVASAGIAAVVAGSFLYIKKRREGKTQ